MIEEWTIKDKGGGTWNVSGIASNVKVWGFGGAGKNIKFIRHQSPGWVDLQEKREYNLYVMNGLYRRNPLSQESKNMSTRLG